MQTVRSHLFLVASSAVLLLITGCGDQGTNGPAGEVISQSKANGNRLTIPEALDSTGVSTTSGCASATLINALPYFDDVDTSQAVSDPSDPSPGCGNGSHDKPRWYRFLASRDTDVTAFAFTDYGSILSVYTGTCGHLVPVPSACSDFGFPIFLHVVTGTTYYFLVSAYDNDGGGLSFQLAVVPTPTPTPQPTPTGTPVAPSNDACGEAKVVGALPYLDENLDTRGASTAASDPYPPCGTQSRDRRVWYQYSAPRTGAITIEAFGNYQPLISIYTGDCSMLQDVPDGCSAASFSGFYNEADLAISVNAGTTYHIMISDGTYYSGSGGNLTVMVSEGAPTSTPTLTPTPTVPPTPTPPVPPNDACTSPRVVGQLPFSDMVDTRGAGTAATDPYPPCGNGSRDRRVWYEYAPAIDGVITIDAIGNYYQPLISVYTGACGILVDVPDACSDTTFSGFPFNEAALSIRVTSGTVYRVMISDGDYYARLGGNLTVTITAGALSPTPTVTRTDTFPPTATPTATPIPPPNDSCPNAAEIRTLPYSDIVDTRGASLNSTDPSPNCAFAGANVWYRFVATQSGAITADTFASGYSTVLSAYTGTCGALVPIPGACSQTAVLSIPIVAGNTYYLMVSSLYSESGSLGLRVVNGAPTPTPTRSSTPRPPAPPNDSCDDAQVVQQLPFTDTIDTRGASTAATDPYPPCGNGSRDRRVWYQYTATTNGAITIDAVGQYYQPIVSVYTGNCDNLTDVPDGCSASDFFSNQATLAIPVSAGTTYRFMISDADSPPRGGNLTVSITEGVPTFTPTSTPTLTPTSPPAPPNDACDSATVVTELPFNDTVDTRGASTAASDPYPPCGNGSRDRRVWYQYTATTNGAITIDAVGQNYQPIVSVYTGNCNALTNLPDGCSAMGFSEFSFDEAALAIPVSAGATYRIMISNGDYQRFGGNLIVSITAGRPTPTPTPTTTPTFSATGTSTPTPLPPSNDSCANATQIGTLPFIDEIDARGATADPSDPTPSCGFSFGAPSVWYTWTPPENGAISADTIGTGYAIVLSAYTGACGALTQIPGACVGGFSSDREVSLSVTHGTTYHFMITSDFGYSLQNVVFRAFATTLPSPTPTPTATRTRTPTPTHTPIILCCGDLDADGNISTSEATKAILALINRDPASDPAAQCTTPGTVTTADVTNVILNLVNRTCVGPTATPTTTPTATLCGNGVVDIDEDCDVGGTCVGSTNAGTACTSNSQCMGGQCKTSGGHAIEGDSAHTCAANCTFETDVPFNLVSGITTGTDLMAGTSGVSINSSALGIPIPLPLGGACDGGSNDKLNCTVESDCPGGTCAPARQTLTIGKMRNGQIPVVVKAASVKYAGIPVLGFACGCVHGAAAKSCGGTFYEADGVTLSQDCTPGFTDGDIVCTNAGKLPCAFVHGEGNTASGVIGCSGLDGTNLLYEQDSGGSSGPCAEPYTCPGTVTLSGQGGPGCAVIYETLGITAALNSCTGTDPTVYGADGIFCTDDDPIGGLIAVDGILPTVTGTATAVVHNSGGFEGNDLGPLTATGAQFSCSALEQQHDAGGAGIVGAFTFVHVQQVGDVAVTAQLFAR